VSRNLIGAARQQITQAWWDTRLNYDFYISEVISRECAAGDPNAAKKRLAAIEGLPLLRVTTEAIEISKALVARDIIPSKAVEDVLHISIATVHAMDFLLTWNCKHIANPEIQKRIASYSKSKDCFYPSFVLLMNYSEPTMMNDEVIRDVPK